MMVLIAPLSRDNMALTHTPVCDFGQPAIDFALEDPKGQVHTLESCRGDNGLLVAFICNHCPYVKAILTQMVKDFRCLQAMKVGCVAINPNDPTDYPEDDLPHMEKVAQHHQFTFPYLWDASQNVARAYQAVCTPDFFGYNSKLELQYRGRLDQITPQAGSMDVPRELVQAFEGIVATGQGPARQVPSMGCSIKWASH